MGTGGNNVPFVYDTDQYRKMTHEEAERLQCLPIGHTANYSDTEKVASAARYERIGRSLNPLIVRQIMQRIEHEYLEF